MILHFLGFLGTISIMAPTAILIIAFAYRITGVAP